MAVDGSGFKGLLVPAEVLNQAAFRAIHSDEKARSSPGVNARRTGRLEVMSMLWGWQDFDEMFRRLERDVSDLFGRTITPMVSSSGSVERRLTPPIEVLRRDGELAVRVELPGVDPDGIDVAIESNVLRIKAERSPGIAEGVEVVRSEIPLGTYERNLTLPEGVHVENLAARYTNGLLEIVVPYEGRKAFKVPVEVRGADQKELTGSTA
jgi:HSP20 family protein